MPRSKAMAFSKMQLLFAKRTHRHFIIGLIVGVCLGQATVETWFWYRTPSAAQLVAELGPSTEAPASWSDREATALNWKERFGPPTMIIQDRSLNFECWNFHPTYPWKGDKWAHNRWESTRIQFCFELDTGALVSTSLRGSEIFESERGAEVDL